MSNRFTERAQRIVLLAQEEAKRINHDYVGTEHILLGMLALGDGVAAQVLVNLGASPLHKVRAEIEKIVGVGDNVMLLGEIPFTPRAKKVLEYAVEESQHMGQQYVGTEHLLLGCLREEEGVAARVLQNMGLNLSVVREEVLNLLGETKAPQPKIETCSCHPQPAAVDIVTALLIVLGRHELPFNKVERAVIDVRNISDNLKVAHDPQWAMFRALAESLFTI